MTASATDPLVSRNAFADHAHVSTRLVFEGNDARPPLVTIAVPTFRRFDLLVEAVESALAQEFDRVVEVIVVDNDPETDGPARLAERLPQLRAANFRYYVNAENIGMFGNWNRCIELGRGAWHTLLNDDDLLDRDFTRTMFRALDRNPAIDALICRKRTLDERPGRALPPTGGARRLAQRAWLEARFGGRTTRRISPRLLFWGGVIGNTVGLIARKRDLVALGGYQPEEYPTADWYLQVRLAVRLRFHLHRSMLASIRIAVNESMGPEMWKGFFRNGRRMHLILAGTKLPGWWRHLSPHLLEIYRADARDGLGYELSRDEVGRELGVRLRSMPRLTFVALRLMLRGY
jgi:GT2 family glycosyltransferase